MSNPAVDVKREVHASDYHPLLPEVRADPYPYYAALRRESPVHQIIPGMPFYCVTRYDEVLFVLQHPELFSSTALQVPRRGGGPSLYPGSDALADHRLFES